MDKITRVCNALPCGMDGYRMVGIFDAILAVVPALATLPQPVFKPLGHPALADMVDNEHFYRDPGFLKRPEFGSETLVVITTCTSVARMSWLNTRNISQLLFDFSKPIKAPEGFNGWFEFCRINTFENGRLVLRGSFFFLPEFRAFDVSPLDWQVSLE